MSITEARKRGTRFTLLSRLVAVIKSRDGRRHLRKTWRFSLNQALRAASGLQLSEVLEQLNALPVEPGAESNLTSGFVTKEAFREVAIGGKRKGHENVYSTLALSPSEVQNVLEIGIGTNDPKAPSSMGKSGIPGASLVMWSQFFPHARVIGADVDPRSFVTYERVSSTFVDQTKSESILSLSNQMSQVGLFDLIIDDGLHTPEANLRTFRHLHQHLNLGGYYVVEDIDPAWTGLWRLIGSSLKDYETHCFEPTSTNGQAHTFFVAKRTR